VREEQGLYTIVGNELSAKPSFNVPKFLLTCLFKKDATKMIERLQTEIAARQPAPRITRR
jgi:hypothetical protein